MDTKEQLKYNKTVYEFLDNTEGINMADDRHVEGNFVERLIFLYRVRTPPRNPDGFLF